MEHKMLDQVNQWQKLQLLGSINFEAKFIGDIYQL
jgi:hypothetical protein